MSGTTTVDIKADYGALLIGGLISFGLSGCVNMQFIVYWQIYSREQWSTKALVTVTWFLDLCHTVFVAVALWDSIIVSYGNTEMVDHIPWSVGPTVQFTAIITFLVQSFCAYRIYRLQNRNLTTASLVVSLAFCRLVAATVSTAEMLILKHYSTFIERFTSPIFTLGLALSAFVDVMITACICYYLRTNRSMIPSTNRVIDSLTFWTVQNGSITSIAAIVTLICWTVMPHNRIYLGLHFVIAKLYANSLLATLNARSTMRSSQKYSPTPLAGLSHDMFGDGDGQDIPAPVHAGRKGQYAVSTNAVKLQPLNFANSKSVEVNVERMVESKYDEDVIHTTMPLTARSDHQM